MNWDQIAGDWKQFTGKVKEKWGKLTDDDLTTFAGKRDQLAGLLQERYGYAKDQAERETRRVLEELEPVRLLGRRRGRSIPAADPVGPGVMRIGRGMVSDPPKSPVFHVLLHRHDVSRRCVDSRGAGGVRPVS